jgi:hypothetical protein
VLFTGEPKCQRLETPAYLTIRSGHQGSLHLVDFVTPDGQAGKGLSGVEIRIFLQPWKYPLIRTNPFEVEGTNCVAGPGTGWTTEEALKAIKEWPTDR